MGRFLSYGSSIRFSCSKSSRCSSILRCEICWCMEISEHCPSVWLRKCGSVHSWFSGWQVRKLVIAPARLLRHSLPLSLLHQTETPGQAGRMPAYHHLSKLWDALWSKYIPPQPSVMAKHVIDRPVHRVHFPLCLSNHVKWACMQKLPNSMHKLHDQQGAMIYLNPQSR